MSCVTELFLFVSFGFLMVVIRRGFRPDFETFSSSSLPSSSSRSLISATAFLAALNEKSGFRDTLGMNPSSVGVQR